jgi:DNA-binding MurR/RpiR family transcriptional regulator
MSRFINKLESFCNSGNDTEIRVAQQLVKLELDISGMSAITLGNLCGVSNASIVRFSQSMGYKGYSALKYDYMAAKQRFGTQCKSSTGVETRNETQSLLNNIAYALTDRIEGALEGVDSNMIDLAAERLLEADKILIVIGRSPSIIATHVAHKLMQLKKTVIHSENYQVRNTYAGLANKNDIALVLGEHEVTPDHLEQISRVKALGGRVVSIAERGLVELTDVSDVVVSYQDHKCSVGVISCYSEISQLVLMDIILHKMVLLQSD